MKDRDFMTELFDLDGDGKVDFYEKDGVMRVFADIDSDEDNSDEDDEDDPDFDMMDDDEKEEWLEEHGYDSDDFDD